jgi:hypothetical protein
VEAGLCGLDEEIEFLADGAGEASTVRCAAAGGDDGGFGVVCKELLALGQGGGWLIEVVETELQERSLLDGGGGALEHLVWRGSDDGNADLADAGTKMLCVRVRQWTNSRLLWISGSIWELSIATLGDALNELSSEIEFQGPDFTE